VKPAPLCRQTSDPLDVLSTKRGNASWKYQNTSLLGGWPTPLKNMKVSWS
jgi:hypothetical protein